MDVRVGDQEKVVPDVDTIDRAAGVHPGIPLVGGDLVVDKGDVVSPAPHGDDDVALDTLWPGWRLRDGAGRDPVTPVSEHLQPAIPAESGHEAVHQTSALTPLDTVIPRRDRGVEVVEIRNFPGDQAPELVATLAPFQVVHPLAERPEPGVDPIALGTRTGELARVR